MCNAWFDACRDDLTCVEDWLADFDYAVNGNNTCPVNSTCVTFEEMYGDGQGLCNRMWGDAFAYSEDSSNCTVMTFDRTGPNPNFLLSFPTAGSHGLQAFSSSIVLVIFLIGLLV